MSVIPAINILRREYRYSLRAGSSPVFPRFRQWLASLLPRSKDDLGDINGLPSVACHCGSDDEVEACRRLAERLNVPYRIVVVFPGKSDGMHDADIVPLRHIESELEYAGRLLIIRVLMSESSP